MTGRVGSLKPFLRLPILLLTLTFLLSATGWSVDWPPLEPTDLSMTTLPQPAGAAAVVLLRDETANDPMNYHEVYVRIKIRDRRGKKLRGRRDPVRAAISPLIRAVRFNLCQVPVVTSLRQKPPERALGDGLP